MGESFCLSSESLGLRKVVVTLRSPFTPRADACAEAREKPVAAKVARRASIRARRARPGWCAMERSSRVIAARRGAGDGVYPNRAPEVPAARVCSLSVRAARLDGSRARRAPGASEPDCRYIARESRAERYS